MPKRKSSLSRKKKKAEVVATPDLWDVEAIRSHWPKYAPRDTKNIHYRVKWQLEPGVDEYWPEEENWIPEVSMCCDEMLDAYWEAFGKAMENHEEPEYSDPPESIIAAATGQESDIIFTVAKKKKKSRKLSKPLKKIKKEEPPEGESREQVLFFETSFNLYYLQITGEDNNEQFDEVFQDPDTISAESLLGDVPEWEHNKSYEEEAFPFPADTNIIGPFPEVSEWLTDAQDALYLAEKKINRGQKKKVPIDIASQGKLPLNTFFSLCRNEKGLDQIPDDVVDNPFEDYEDVSPDDFVKMLKDLPASDFLINVLRYFGATNWDRKHDTLRKLEPIFILAFMNSLVGEPRDDWCMTVFKNLPGEKPPYICECILTRKLYTVAPMLVEQAEDRIEVMVAKDRERLV